MAISGIVDQYVIGTTVVASLTPVAQRPHSGNCLKPGGSPEISPKPLLLTTALLVLYICVLGTMKYRLTVLAFKYTGGEQCSLFLCCSCKLHPF